MEDVYLVVKEDNPRVALGTVYQALSVLEEIGLIEAKHWPESLFCRVEGKLGWSRTLSCMRKIYPTDLFEEEWDCLKARLPVSKLPGRLRTHSLRDIFDAIFYLLRSGCP